jgi:hypothetical protein
LAFHDLHRGDFRRRIWAVSQRLARSCRNFCEVMMKSNGLKLTIAALIALAILGGDFISSLTL